MSRLAGELALESQKIHTLLAVTEGMNAKWTGRARGRGSRVELEFDEPELFQPIWLPVWEKAGQQA